MHNLSDEIEIMTVFVILGEHLLNNFSSIRRCTFNMPLKLLQCKLYITNQYPCAPLFEKKGPIRLYKWSNDLGSSRSTCNNYILLIMYLFSNNLLVFISQLSFSFPTVGLRMISEGKEVN